MRHLPDFDTFDALASENRLVPVYRQVTADTLTPVEVFCKLQSGESTFLFESVVGGERVGRFSFVGSNPIKRIDAYGTDVVITSGDAEPKKYTAEDPLRELENLLKEYNAARLPELPPFCGGAVGYAGYDVVRYCEHLPNAPEDDRQLPDLSFAIFDRMVIFDHIRKTILIVAHADVSETDSRAAYDKAAAQVDAICDQLQHASSEIQMSDISLGGEPTLAFKSNFEQSEFEDAVERCKEYIKAGDIFQVVISQRLSLETKASPLDIYRALRVVNPSPFMFFMETQGANLVGASPEIMVRSDEGEITIRPLAGTRKRGATPEEDQALADELLADEKERAEHVMLVDLARNDVGRVAKYGSVKLNDVMVVERYSHVMHITSNVYGDLRDGLTALDALRAGLPAGTVSGAPKVRAMQIIDEMERHRRGPYAGAVGYIDFSGNMDTCIALRTLVMQGQTAYVQAGAGIVADSVPESEYHETLNKAKGLLKAIEVAETQL
jgi:anthranilate synthase component I